MSPPRAQVVNEVVAAVVRVLRISLGEHATLAGLNVTRAMDPAPSIAVTIQLSGSLHGPIICVFSRELATQITVRLTLDDAPSGELLNDAVAELTNIVLGNAIGPLAEAGYHVEIATPVVHSNEFRPGLLTDTLVATLSAPSGTVRVFLGAEVTA